MEMTEEQKQKMSEAEEKEKENRAVIDGLINSGKLPALRSMTRKQRRDMDAAGANIGKFKRDDMRTFVDVRDTMCDWILDNVYSGWDFDALDNNVTLAFALLTYKMTYEDTLAAKNS